MSSYRWITPRSAGESMYYFQNFASKTLEETDEMLWEAVKRGDIRVMINDVIVPREHIAYFLILYREACSDQPPFTLPPDMAVSYDDMLAVFDRARPDNRKRGRPVKENSGWTEDQKLAFEMHKMLASNNPDKPNSPTAAARSLVLAGQVRGAGTEESKVKRLMREFRKRYTS
jgi:hypothetical protein